MALSDSELERIKHELRYHLLAVGAEPYIAFRSYFTQVLQPYLSSGAATTSTTTVTAATTPTPVALTLASATGFAAGSTVIVDVDARQESATVQSITGAVITVLLTKAHSGTYPVSVESGETIVREILGRLRALEASGGAVDNIAANAGVKKVDEIEFFGNEFGGAAFRQIDKLRRHYQNRLASVLGIPSIDGGGGALSPY